MKNNNIIAFLVYFSLLIAALFSCATSYSYSVPETDNSNEMVLIKRYRYEWLHKTDRQKKNMPVVIQWEYQGDEEQQLELSGDSRSASELLRVTLPEGVKTAGGYFTFCSEAFDGNKPVRVTPYHSRYFSAYAPEPLYQKKRFDVNTRQKTSGYRHIIHMPHKNESSTDKLDIQLSNAQFSNACSPVLFDDSGSLSYIPLVIHRFGRSMVQSGEPGFTAAPSAFPGQQSSPGNESSSGGGYDVSPPFDGKPGPEGRPVMPYRDFVIEMTPYQEDAAETRLNETTRSMLYSLGYTENVFTITVRQGEYTRSRHLSLEDWERLLKYNLLNSPAFLLSLVTETSNENFRQRIIELIGHIEQENTGAILLWSEEILSLTPEQITIDVWLEKKWQELIAEITTAAAAARTAANGESGQQSQGRAPGETGTPSAPSGSQSSGTPTDQNGDGSNSGHSSGGAGRQPPRDASAQSTRLTSKKSQEQILQQIINLLKSSKEIDEDLLKVNLFDCISKLSPEAINWYIEGAPIFYHLVDLMDENKRSLLNELAEHLLKEGKADPFVICGEKSACNQSLHRAAQRGFSDIARWIIEMDSKAINFLDGNRRLPIHYALENKDVELVKLLLPSQVPFYLQKDKNGKSPLLLSIQSGNPELLKLIAEKMQGRFIQALKDGIDEAFNAISRIEAGNLVAMLKALYEEGLDVNWLNSTRDSLLGLCAENKNPKAMEWLVEHGADITSINVHYLPPLFLALKPNAEESFKRELVDDILSASKKGRGKSIMQIFQDALSGSNNKLFEYVQKIIEKYIIEGNVDYLRFWAELGVFNVETFRSKNNKSALKLALEKKQYQVVGLLVDLDANVDESEGGIRHINYIFDYYNDQFNNWKKSFFIISIWNEHKDILFELFIKMFEKTDCFHERNWPALIKAINDYEKKDFFYLFTTPMIYTSRFLREKKVSERLKEILEVKQELQKKGWEAGILSEEKGKTELQELKREWGEAGILSEGKEEAELQELKKEWGKAGMLSDKKGGIELKDLQKKKKGD